MIRLNIKLHPAGVIPRDPKLRVQLAREVVAQEPAATEPTAIPPIELSGTGTFSGPPIGTVLLVTLIGGGGGGGVSEADVFAGPGGGAGKYIRKKPYTYTGPVSFTTGGGGASDSDGGDTSFDTLTAEGATWQLVGMNWCSVGGGNAYGFNPDGTGLDGFQIDDYTWAGANGGLDGYSNYANDYAAAKGGDSPITNATGAGSVVGADGGVWLNSHDPFSGPGGGGAASAFGTGGIGGDVDHGSSTGAEGVSAAIDSYGAGGGGAGMDSGDSSNWAGGAGAAGRIIIEFA